MNATEARYRFAAGLGWEVTIIATPGSAEEPSYNNNKVSPPATFSLQFPSALVCFCFLSPSINNFTRVTHSLLSTEFAFLRDASTILLPHPCSLVLTSTYLIRQNRRRNFLRFIRKFSCDSPNYHTLLIIYLWLSHFQHYNIIFCIIVDILSKYTVCPIIENETVNISI